MTSYEFVIDDIKNNLLRCGKAGCSMDVGKNILGFDICGTKEIYVRPEKLKFENFSASIKFENCEFVFEVIK